MISLRNIKKEDNRQKKDNISILCKRTYRVLNLQRKILKQFVSKIVGFYHVSFYVGFYYNPTYILTRILSLVKIFSKEMLLMEEI